MPTKTLDPLASQLDTISAALDKIEAGVKEIRLRAPVSEDPELERELNEFDVWLEDARGRFAALKESP